MTSPKVVPIGRRRKSAPPGGSEHARIEALEEELRRLRARLAASGESEDSPEREGGLLVALARAFELGGSAFNWPTLGRLARAWYFAWHSEQVDDFGYDPKFNDTIEPFFEFLYTVWWRVETTGLQHVPGTGPGLIVANHSGVLPWDGAMIRIAVRHEHPAKRQTRMLALDMFALLPFLAPLLAQTGSVRASQENGERLLLAGDLVGVFPEGVKGVGKPFRQRYKLARFGRGGFIRLALRTGAPIIPCAVVGAEEVHPMIGRADFLGKPFGFPYFPITPTFPHFGLLGVVPLPSKWSIDFADPIATTDFGPAAAEDPILVNRLSEQVRSTIQRMIDGRLARRRSIWFG